ncbi:MAG: lipid II flippase MurJ [Saprospiraceae bacterium]
MSKKRMLFNITVVFTVLGFIGSIVLLVYLLSVGLSSIPINIMFIMAFVVISIPSSLTEHFLLLKDNARSLIYYSLIVYAGYLLIIVSATIRYNSIAGVLYALVVWAFLRFLYLLYYVNKHAVIEWDSKLSFRFLIFALPLIISVMASHSMDFVDGFIVEHYLSKSDFTIFRYGARELPLNTILISAFATAMVPLAMISFDQTLAKVKERTSKMMNWLFPISIMLMISSPYLFTRIYSNDFFESASVFNIYLLIICSRILLPQVVLYANHKNNVLMIVGAIELCINIFLSLYLLPIYGIQGIAFATVIAFIIQKIILIIYTWKVLSISVTHYLNVPQYIGYSILLYSIYFLVTSIMNIRVMEF